MDDHVEYEPAEKGVLTCCPDGHVVIAVRKKGAGTGLALHLSLEDVPIFIERLQMWAGRVKRGELPQHGVEWSWRH